MQENSEEDAKQKIKTEWETKNKEAAYIYLLVGRTSTVYNGKRNETLCLKIRNAYAGAIKRRIKKSMRFEVFSHGR